MINDGKLNDLARAELDALRAAGVQPTDAEIVEINALGWSVETPQGRQELSRGCPVEVGGAWLWPLTLEAADWLERAAESLPDELCGAATAYAMAHCYSGGDAFLVSGGAIPRTVKRWAAKLRCTPRALVEAVELVNSQGADPELPTGDSDAIAAHAGMGRGDYSAFLAAATGQSPEFWETRCAQSYTFAVLQTIIRQKLAESGAPLKDDAKIKAEIALGWAAEKAKRRWREQFAEKTEPCDG